ncbi:putative Adrenodoxin, mitochondrial [Hypsibius exemplaris]|uniref:Adrenodoxin, mitochondrial n=1 Tax=Hypsibius exemplaris TaxID=2072580 RepID=A0A1W0X495_HYPEX|nr:putative Adrenodoxin, mitochondrial [Hypsibius exemplaris]
MQRLLPALGRSLAFFKSGNIAPVVGAAAARDTTWYFNGVLRGRRWNATSAAPSLASRVAGKNEFKVKFIREGKTYDAYGKAGDTLLDVIINNDLDFDGFGACEGTLACSTCHVIVPQAEFDRLPNKPCDEELDMLDLAYDLTKTSRLGCQIEISADLDGIEVTIPATRHDARG